MDDLIQKSDDELKTIMRASIDNSYVPSSIYHKAKQELEFRAAERQGISINNVDNSNIALGSNNIKQSSHTLPPSGASQDKTNRWFWWTMSIVAGLLVLLIGAYVFGVGK